MNDVTDKSVNCVPDSAGGRWKLPALMALSFAFSESVLCVMTTLFKHDWLLFAVSVCGPIAMGLGVLFTLRSPGALEQDAASITKVRDEQYRLLLIFSAVYVVTYGFYYGAVQILLREGAGGR